MLKKTQSDSETPRAKDFHIIRSNISYTSLDKSSNENKPIENFG